MFGPEPNVTHTASWQQPCHGDVYTNPALLFTIQHSHHRAGCKLPLWKLTMCLCVSLSVCVCTRKNWSECVFLCDLIEIQAQIQYQIHAYTLHQHPAVMHTPHIHSLNSHPALWCVLYYSILPFSKAHTLTRTRAHAHAHPLPGTRGFTVHLNMHSHLVHTDTAVIWHSGTIGLCFIWCDLTAGQLEEEGNGVESRGEWAEYSLRREDG